MLRLQKLGKKEVGVITEYVKRISSEVSEAKTGFVVPFVYSLKQIYIDNSWDAKQNE